MTVEYRGVRKLVYAKVTEDSIDAFTTGEVKPLAGVATITKTRESSSESHYYDNQPAIVIASAGADEITCEVSAIPLSVLADITGQKYDAVTGMLIEGNMEPGYFALGYITETTDNVEMFVWRYKGTFGIPEVTHATKDDGTDANGQEVTFTGVATTHPFTKTGGLGAMGIVVDTSINTTVTEATFFSKVTTPDEIGA